MTSSFIPEHRQVWSNWSGDIRFTPLAVEYPQQESDLQRIVQQAIDRRQIVRAIGSRHSCSAIFATDEVLVVPDQFKGLIAYDPRRGTATVGAGMTVEEVGESLFSVGMGMENTGHIDEQAIAGAISTGTHGAGKKLGNLSGQVLGVRLVTGTGDVKEFNTGNDPELMQALKVSLGSMGIFTQITLKALPAFQLHRRQYCCSTEACMDHLPALMEENRNFCFYWYPRRDEVSLRLWNPPGESTRQ